MISSDDKISQIIKRFKSQELEILSEINSGGSATVHTAKWKGTSATYAIKRFRNSSISDIINEVYLMEMVRQHPNIISICGVTTLEGEENYSLVLEYADSGTLGEYLRKNVSTFKWEDQLKFANGITSAISCLHSHDIIHGDLHPGNVLIHQHSIKIADFGCSHIHGSVINKKGVYGVVPYMDPKILNGGSYHLTKKSDVYSLAVLLWQLTSCKSPFESEEVDLETLKINIIIGKREDPFPDTNDKYIELYQKCWKFEPDVRPDIFEIVSTLKSISEKHNTTTNLEGETTKEPKNENFSCQI